MPFLQDTSVTFCLKEFRSLLIFAEFCQLPIMATFSDGGSPLILSLSQGDTLSCTYVLATLAEDASMQPQITTAGDSQTSQPTRSAPATAAVQQVSLLHSTQRDSSALETEQMSLGVTPDISNIPQPNTPDPDEIEQSPPAKKKNFLFRYRLLLILNIS